MAKNADKVELFIPIDPRSGVKYTYLCVNGKNMVVKHGERVMVPPEFKAAYDDSVAQKMAAYHTQQKYASNN